MKQCENGHSHAMAAAYDEHHVDVALVDDDEDHDLEDMLDRTLSCHEEMEVSCGRRNCSSKVATVTRAPSSLPEYMVVHLQRRFKSGSEDRKVTV